MIRFNRAFSFAVISLIAAANSYIASGQRLPVSAQAKSAPSVAQLIEQGKALYRTQKFKPALAKFEAALKLAPENNEALGLAAETAFRLDNQPQSRDYFMRRAGLSGQTNSVKAFSYYRVSLTYWREAHDLVAKSSEIKAGKVIVAVPKEIQAEVRSKIESGLKYAGNALAISKNFAEAHNILNLLHAEAAIAARDEKDAREHRKQSIESLRRAMEFSKSPAKGGEMADFSLPTIRVSEFAHTDEDEAKIEDPMKKLITGGKPVTRTQAIFPSAKAAKASNIKDPSAKGLTSDGGAYSLGAGRGALTAAYTPGLVKVEVLISATGDVVFGHIVDGRPDLNGAAILAARSWKFEPAKFEGKQIQVSGVITFDMKPEVGKKADKETGRPGEKGTRGQGDKGTKGPGDKGTKGSADKGTKGQGDKKRI
ncbi:MAG TPA: energy transducer TonB [Blastocatellia bacterium]|nr:energy transducer TonB [Blastocatellia bacterium]